MGLFVCLFVCLFVFETVYDSFNSTALHLTSDTHLCAVLPVVAQFQTAPLGGTMAAVLGLICLMVTGVTVLARKVRKG